MGTQVEILQIPATTGMKAKVEELQPAADAAVRRRLPLDSLAKEQIESLVYQVFFAAPGRTRKQVVFSAVDEEVDVGGICLLVAESLAMQVGETVAVVDAHAHSQDRIPRDESETNGSHLHLECDREQYEQLAENLWSVPGRTFWGTDPLAGSPGWVGQRLAAFRAEFDYNVIHAPAAGMYSGTCLLGRASDGLVLVIEANYTRRSAAQKTRETLYAANVRLLGTLLSGRTFPIPEAIYRRL